MTIHAGAATWELASRAGTGREAQVPANLTVDISIQYLEGGSRAGAVSPREARGRLRIAFEDLPLAMVLLGWDLPLRVVEACAEECALQGADLYLWQPLLTAHGSFQPDPAWYVVALNGHPVVGYAQRPEFTFVCPNRPDAREGVLHHLSAAIAGGFYRGVFLDRIRFPSPAGDLARQLGCFCDACREVSRQAGFDLSTVRQALLSLLASREGRHASIRRLLSASSVQEPQGPLQSLEHLMQFRQRSISAIVKEAAEIAIAGGLRVGLDCYTPTLARMVGQDLPALATHCDWIKVMTYVRAYVPASLPFEILGLADWLMGSGGESELAAMSCLAEATGWPLPACREEVRHGGLSPSILTEEVRRGRVSYAHPLLAGIELVEIPGVAEFSADQIRIDAEAVLAGAPDGIVLSWDLMYMSANRLRLANFLYHCPTTPSPLTRPRAPTASHSH